MQLRAPAKINLSFRILRRRDDGFHEVETLMSPISLHDELTITRRRGGGEIELVCDDPTIPSGDDNLVVRAARLFCETTHNEVGLTIRLQKNVPHGAGLGGGSSDAASVLLALNQLFDANLPVESLAALAAQIGSDVPFFIYQSAAFCGGRGEIVTPTRLAAALPLLLLKPAFGVPTPWAYSRWQNAKELPGTSYASQTFRGLEFVNDLERPVFEKYVFLARMKTWLLAQPEVGAALLSGSGSTVFAALHDGSAAAELATRAKAELDPTLWSAGATTLLAR